MYKGEDAMRAAVFEGRDSLRIREVADPAVGREEVLVRVKACGVCATDLHTLRGESISGEEHYPLIPGHEVAGVVEETGTGVLEVAPGDRVIIDPIFPCGQCHFCRNNLQNHCLHQRTLGTTVDGGFAELVAVPASAVHNFSGTSFAAAALAEPLSTVVYGQERAEIGYGDEVLVIGAGALGLLHLLLARVSGASRVTVVDSQESRLEKAEELGADAVFHRRVELEEGEEVRRGVGALVPDAVRKSRPPGYDVVIEATGAPAVVEAAVRYLKPTGRLLVFGVSPQHSEVRFNPYDIYRYDWKIVGVFALNKTLGRARALLENRIDLEPVVAGSYALEEFPHALEDLEQGRAAGKLQVTFL